MWTGHREVQEFSQWADLVRAVFFFSPKPVWDVTKWNGRHSIYADRPIHYVIFAAAVWLNL